MKENKFSLNELERVIEDLKYDDSFHDWYKTLDGEDVLINILEETKNRIIKLWGEENEQTNN